MSNESLEHDGAKCNDCIFSEEQFYTDGDLFMEAFPISMCGNCIHNSSAEDNYEPKEGGV